MERELKVLTGKQQTAETLYNKLMEGVGKIEEIKKKQTYRPFGIAIGVGGVDIGVSLEWQPKHATSDTLERKILWHGAYIESKFGNEDPFIFFDFERFEPQEVVRQCVEFAVNTIEAFGRIEQYRSEHPAR